MVTIPRPPLTVDVLMRKLTARPPGSGLVMLRESLGHADGPRPLTSDDLMRGYTSPPRAGLTSAALVKGFKRSTERS